MLEVDLCIYLIDIASDSNNKSNSNIYVSQTHINYFVVFPKKPQDHSLSHCCFFAFSNPYPVKVGLHLVQFIR